MHGEQFRITLDLPPMSAMFFKIKNKRTPPSQLPESAQAEVPAEAAVPVTLPLLNEERPVVDAPEERSAPEKPAEITRNAIGKQKAAPSKPGAETARTAEDGDHHTKFTAHKVGTGGNI